MGSSNDCHVGKGVKMTETQIVHLQAVLEEAKIKGKLTIAYKDELYDIVHVRKLEKGETDE